jgi:AAA family ATP:ADP antiporter
MSMSDAALTTPEFSKLRATLWPIHASELKKFVPMLLLFFLLTFDYNILRIMKDTIVVTARDSGAEVIPFIKVWVMFPGSILMTVLFTWLSTRYSNDRVFYIMMGLFLGFFALFTFGLYPLRDSLHPHDMADNLQSILPAGCKGLVAMFRNWTFSLFYAMSELWSNIILSVLCWGFANQITRLHEAKRFYGLFGIGANASGIVAGQVSIYLGSKAWDQSLTSLTILILLAGVSAVLIFRWIHQNAEKEEILENERSPKEKKAKEKYSLRESLSYLLGSKYVMSIAFIIIAYNIVINLVEVVWKDEVKALYPNSQEFNIYMNQVSTFIGILATCSAIFISGNSIRKFGWTTTALLTPIILLVTSIGFFTFFFMKGRYDHLLIGMLGTTPLAMVVFFGSAQNILCRAAKYSVFDATKEMSLIPLTDEEKVKSKAAIDGVCNRLGKSGGSIIHQGLLFTFASIAASAPYVMGILMGIICLWILSVRVVGRQFDEINNVTKRNPENLTIKNLI